MTEANRNPTPAPPQRGLWAVAVTCAILALALATVAVLRSPSEAAVLDVSNAIIDTPPSTVAPLPIATAPISGATTVRGPEGIPGPDAGEVTTDGGLSPLADQLGDNYSAVPAELTPRPIPVAAATSSIDLTPYPIRAVGLQDDGQLEIPDETEIGWYRYGATAGRPGATVLAAHVSWNETTGPFFQLGTMRPGDQITVTLDDGLQRTYQVTERITYDKNELPRNRIWRTTGDEQLVLITCGGDFNPDIGRYRQNIVIYASPIS